MKLKIEEIINIIKEPVHGEGFYTREQLMELVKRVNEICIKLDITKKTSQIEIIHIINDYIKKNVSFRHKYFDAFCKRVENFDKDELIYRTAYGALVKGEAICVGFAEAERILLSQYGIKTYTILAKLPSINKRLLHYVVLAEYYDNKEKNFITLDPERQEHFEEKGRNYEHYKEKMLYMLPTTLFVQNAVGKDGVGISAEEYIEKSGVKLVKGTRNIQSLIEIKEKGDENDGNR